MRERPPARTLINNQHANRPPAFLVVFDVIFQRLCQRGCDATAAAGTDRRFIRLILAHAMGGAGNGRLIPSIGTERELSGV
jgi:hypothetical protein